MRTLEMSAAERKDVMASMSGNFENQEDPKVGIFWYNETDDELFGVTAVDARELAFDDRGRKTIGTLHKSWWKKQQERAKAKNQTCQRIYERLHSDTTGNNISTPRRNIRVNVRELD